MIIFFITFYVSCILIYPSKKGINFLLWYLCNLNCRLILFLNKCNWIIFSIIYQWYTVNILAVTSIRIMMDVVSKIIVCSFMSNNRTYRYVYTIFFNLKKIVNCSMFQDIKYRIINLSLLETLWDFIMSRVFLSNLIIGRHLWWRIYFDIATPNGTETFITEPCPLFIPFLLNSFLYGLVLSTYVPKQLIFFFAKTFLLTFYL